MSSTLFIYYTQYSLISSSAVPLVLCDSRTLLDTLYQIVRLSLYMSFMTIPLTTTLLSIARKIEVPLRIAITPERPSCRPLIRFVWAAGMCRTLERRIEQSFLLCQPHRWTDPLPMATVERSRPKLLTVRGGDRLIVFKCRSIVEDMLICPWVVMTTVVMREVWVLQGRARWHVQLFCTALHFRRNVWWMKVWIRLRLWACH